MVVVKAVAGFVEALLLLQLFFLLLLPFLLLLLLLPLLGKYIRVGSLLVFDVGHW